MNNIEHTYNKAILYTDGSCNVKTRVGGIGIYGHMYIDGKESVIEISRGFKGTKTGRMEIIAVIYALRSIPIKDRNNIKVFIISDSQYVTNGAMLWIDNWKIQGFCGIKNPDLWMEYLELRQQFKFIRVKWVKGHNGNVGNEIADVLAYNAYKGNLHYVDLEELILT